jgi:hypothetical protein
MNKTILILSLILIAFSGQSQNIEKPEKVTQLMIDVGNKDFSNWSGITKIKDNVASFQSGTVISYRYPDAEKTYKGFREYYAYASDWSTFAGISFDLFLKAESNAKIDVSFQVAEQDTGKLLPRAFTTLQVTGSGWKTIFIPWDHFNIPLGQRMGMLMAVKQLNIKTTSKENSLLQVRDVSVTKGQFLSLSAPIKGKSTKAGSTIKYVLEVGNTSKNNTSVQLLHDRYGWESMQIKIKPSSVELAPGEVKKCTLEVFVPANLPKATREKQIIKAVSNGNGATAESLEFISAVEVPFPYMVHTEEGWNEVADKIEKYEWAKEGLADYESTASKWKVPDYATELSSQSPNFGMHLFHDSETKKMFHTAIAYELTGNKEYVNKCVTFLRKIIDPGKGYLSTYRACHHQFVHEGQFFQNIARAYDIIHDSEVLTEKDHQLVEVTFRAFVETVQLGTARGGINNWNLSKWSGAFYCAMALQDWHLIDFILHGPGGIYDHFSHGVMSDGWWFECTVSYNLWCSTMFSEIGLALRPWGVNFLDEQIPLGTTPHFSLIPERNINGFLGMSFMKWGAKQKSSAGIVDMWNAQLPFMDYRGVVFGVNDAQETRFSGGGYELAYYIYRDPEYAAIIKSGNSRSLLYGVPDLPDYKSQVIKKSAFADNVGVVQLRSQTEGREQREQIQAVLHYGTHGGYHGHFDRTGLLSMMRYGRSFFNPEMVWYGYGSYMYKYYVQTSTSKNMVVVDQKMQEPVESWRTLFYTGDMMQATAVETNTRWSYPPFEAMDFDHETDKMINDRTWTRGRSLTSVPEPIPMFHEVTGFTEPILQRRTMVMMDDYVVLADYLKAEEEHTFDWFIHIKGLKAFDADKKEFNRHDNQLNTDPLSSGQFVTDCDWYNTEGTTRASFEMCWGEGCDLEGTRMPNSEEGTLKMDVFNAWPVKQEMLIAMPPESHGVTKKLWYKIMADDEIVVNDSTGAWVLGSKNIDLNIAGKKKLILRTKTSRSKTNTIFWGDARLVLKDGSEVFLHTLPLSFENIKKTNGTGLDYYDGPIKIQGQLCEQSTPGMPANYKEDGLITVDLSGLDVVSFKAQLGGDFPVGDETQRRKTFGSRQYGKEARFLSVIEPYESESVIKSVFAKSANVLHVELLDGRVQEITISDFDHERNDQTKVSVKEIVNGKVVREEKTYK